METSPEDAGGSPTLFLLSARAVTANMERLEEDVWGLPAVILQGLLPLMNIYYLERIEPAAVRKGLNTQSIWCKLWNDIMKSKPSRFGTVTCWRKRFLEAFFHNVLRGILDVSSDRRLSDQRFCPLLHSSHHVSELTICNKQQGVTELPPAVLQCLAQSVETLKFLHLRSSDPGTQKSLRRLLHHLIHHGRVHKVSVLSWPCPDNQLLVLILSISAGYWEPDPDSPCSLCSQTTHDTEPGGDPRSCVPPGRAEESSGLSALLSLQPLNISQNVVSASEQSIAPPVKRAARSPLSRKGTAQHMPPDGTSSPTSQTGLDPAYKGPAGGHTSDHSDLYDFIFSVSTLGEGNAPETPPEEEKAIVGASPLFEVIHYRSVRALNLHNIPLTLPSCRSLCHLLCSWTALERLTMAYNDLGANIQLVLEALSALSRDPRCCLRVLSLSDFTTFVPMLELAHAVLRIFPHLQLLSLSYDLESHKNRLQTLELRFPQDPVRVERLVSVLTASRSLLELSLDNATFPGHDDLRRLLRVIADCNTSLRRLSFHDMKMSDVHREILHLLNHSRLEEMKFSFCRLFEEGSSDFLMDFVAAIKRNPNVRILKLSGNRLGNEGLCALADLFSSDSVSGIHYLDVSSNCIKPDGLLRFAQKLEGRGTVKLLQLSVSQNLLDRDPVLAREALQSLAGVCCVVSDSWDSGQAFADHVSVM
ncbi:leucine-rich repeat-containing protein 41 isoform X2 [Phyllobates terribilis]|uniref:leucine-rich repeat-containing protein 41 isoform X2 n=1 Tax=Phyllobates terribilis TaxID=111132 RepID=UPI003CCA83E7